jgi:integrative and conjugative element protein (TIGR02256 family)
MRPAVTIANAAARAIVKESAASDDGAETGGILLGHDDDGPFNVRIAGGPGPAAKRSPRRFLRDLEHARVLADEAYDVDGSVWIGEWHTHPNGPAAPSALDLTTYAGHLADNTLGFARYLSLIVLPCPKHRWDHVHVAAWVVDSGGGLRAAEVFVEGDPG